MNQGYSVYWDVTNEHTGRTTTFHRAFHTLQGATSFHNAIEQKYKPRLFENRGLTEDERSAVARDTTAHANRRALVELMLQHGITIPTKQFDMWRPTKRASGAIKGLHTNLEIIATDGLLAWFLTPEGEVWSGHIQCFDGKVEPLHGTNFTGTMTKKVKKPKEKSKLQLILESM